MTDNNTTDHNKRIADLLSELFLKAADEAAGRMAVGQDSIEELVTTSVAAAIQSNELDAMDEDAVRSICDDAMDDRIGYDELVTSHSFNDYLEDSDVLHSFAREDYVDDAVMHAVNELETEFATVEYVKRMAEEGITWATVNQMMLELETDLEAAKLSSRIKASGDKLLTLTKRTLFQPYRWLQNLTKLRLTVANTNKEANDA